MADNNEDSIPDIMVLKFADSSVPIFKEKKGAQYIEYGENNAYPDYLTHLYNKSAKHNAIITGKANYIFGNGFENGDFIINRLGESLNDISKKSILDIRIYGGFRWETVWAYNGKIAEIYHVDFNTLRKGKEGGFYYKESWKQFERTDKKEIPSFNLSNKFGSQIYEYNEYRPGTRFYPLPDYLGCNNYIEIDIEISKFYLSSIKNGMMPSKMIQFYIGDPTDEKKQNIENRWKKKFSGSENAGKFVLVFNSGKDKTVDVQDLSGSELDKMFIELNKTTGQEIFSGHNVTSPMLFGIKTEGQLGGSTELQTAYTIFQNTYARIKARDFDREAINVLQYSNFPGKYELRQSDPIGLNIDVKDVINLLPTQFIFEKMGIPKEMWPSAPSPVSQPAMTNVAEEDLSKVAANDNIKNLTAKQHQQLLRIIRQYGKGQLTEMAARILIKTGTGLDDNDINGLLGIQVEALAAAFEKMESRQRAKFAALENDDEIISIFDDFGESKNDFDIVKSRKVLFESDEDAAFDEIETVKDYFLTYDISATENKILELIKKDEKITAEVIAKVIGETLKFVQTKIASLVKRGYIESTIEKIGQDEIIKRIIPKGLNISVPPVKAKVNPTQIYVKYSYEGPKDSKNRPFCAKLMELNRIYSRYEIEKISERLGYSVWDRRGGFWNNGKVILPHCRHNWQSQIVIKKGGSNVA